MPTNLFDKIDLNLYCANRRLDYVLAKRHFDTLVLSYFTLSIPTGWWEVVNGLSIKGICGMLVHTVAAHRRVANRERDKCEGNEVPRLAGECDNPRQITGTGGYHRFHLMVRVCPSYRYIVGCKYQIALGSQVSFRNAVLSLGSYCNRTQIRGNDMFHYYHHYVGPSSSDGGRD